MYLTTAPPVPAPTPATIAKNDFDRDDMVAKGITGHRLRLIRIMFYWLFHVGKWMLLEFDQVKIMSRR